MGKCRKKIQQNNSYRLKHKYMYKSVLKLKEKAFIIYKNVMPLAEFLKNERNLGVKLPLLKRMNLILHGYNSDKYALFDLSKKENFNNYITDYQDRKKAYINGSFKILLNNKLAFTYLFRNYVSVPECFYVIERGILIPLSNSYNLNGNPDIISLLHHKSKLILKPVARGRGEGLLRLEYTKKSYKINSEICDREEVTNLIAKLDNYMVTEFIEQDDYAYQLYPGSTNTIRIITMIDPQSITPFLVTAFQRIGTKKSEPVDNTGAGGIVAFIDIRTGVLDGAYSYAQNIPGGCTLQENHPETGSRIKGTIIPEWTRIIKQVLEVSSYLSPFFKIIGWDILKTKKGITVIECNNSPEFFFQHNSKIKSDQKVYNFFKHHGII